MEDSGWAFDFIVNLIQNMYKDIDIVVVSTGGSGNFRYTYAVRENDIFHYAIFVYDRGKSSGNGALNDNNRKDLLKGIKKFQKRRANTKIKIYSPISMEEALFSFEFLLSEFLTNYNKVNLWCTTLHNQYVQILSGKIEDINFSSYIGNYKSYEQLIEAALEDITENTIYEIRHRYSYISPCWIENCTNCTNIQNLCNITMTSNYINYSDEKIQLVAAHSLLGGLIYLIDKIYGNRYRKFPYIITENSNYKKRLIEEI